MEKTEVLNSITSVREKSPKRKFSQTFDLIINLKGLDLKKPEQNIDVFVPLPHGKGRVNKICALVDDALSTEAKNNCDKVIAKQDFPELAGKKKEIRKLAGAFDFFIAQADAMPQVAATFGRFLGPKGKMPNPKAGCVIPPKAALKPICERLHKTVRLKTKSELILKCAVGKEDLKDESLAENILAVYNVVLHALPQEANNMKSAFLKMTMGPSVRIGKSTEIGGEQQ